MAGTAGAGKSTMADRIGRVLDLPYVELDALFHGPRWTPRPEFAAEVRRFARGPAWVTEYQYREVRPLLLGEADTVVWLDHPRHVVMRRLVLRTVRRRLRGQHLWNGNYEPPLRTVFTDRRHLWRWAWKSHASLRRKLAVMRDGEDGARLAIVRLCGQREVDRWRAGPLRHAAGLNEESSL